MVTTCPKKMMEYMNKIYCGLIAVSFDGGH
jgi:hypothetical protein